MKTVFAGALLLMGVLSMGCSSLTRSSSSGYAGDNSGRFSATPPLSDKERVRALENRLQSTREKEQYSKILPWLENDAEKIAFLSLPSMTERQDWINQNNLWRRSQSSQDRLRSVVDSGDISIGMPMDLVKKSWGDPQTVEASGNPLYKNERWRYMRYISSPDGYKQERRTVYFEGGRVVGWETE
ncbi:MAG: hypothetical protein KF802_12835 [Bdellovibrionaceae bacterium]|nr:hypothetical protein [Pseudobdellovibrionaceae bacterium]